MIARQVEPARPSLLERFVPSKTLGRLYLRFAILMAFVGGGLSVLIRLQLGFPGQHAQFWGSWFPTGMASGIMTPEFYVMLVTMHGTIMVFFVLCAVLLNGLGTSLIPLQLGARRFTIPAVNVLALLAMVGGGGVMLLSFVAEGGAAASGWTANPPLSALEYAIPGSRGGQTWWIVGMLLFLTSFTLFALNAVVTIWRSRTSGLSMMRLPMFAWSQLIVCAVGLLTSPALAVGLILLLFDRSGGTSFFLPAGMFIGDTLFPNEGGRPLLWQHLFWFLARPHVYVIVLPAVGITSEILTTFSRRPLFGYRAMVYAMMAMGGLSFLVWGQHMFVSGMSPFLGNVFVVTALAAAVPSAVILFNWLATLWRGRIRLTTPMLFALAVVSFFVFGGVSGILLATYAANVQLHDTAFVVAHLHFMMAGVGLFAAFGGVYYWFPKLFGRSMSESLGMLHFWATFLGYHAVFLPMFGLGASGMLRRLYDPNTYDYLKPFNSVNTSISLVAFVLVAAQGVFLWNFFWSSFRGRGAEANPWNASSLEWWTPPSGEWDGELPSAHRWPYEYSNPDEDVDFVPQWLEPTHHQDENG